MARAATALLLAALAASVLLATPAATQSVQDIIDSAIKTAQDAVAQAQAQAAAVSNSVATGTTSSSSSATGTGLVGGVPASTCGTLSKTQSSSCANGKCCAVSQQVSACKGRLTATSTVNGKSSTCCVVLLDTKYKNRPAFFCAAPYKKGVNYQLPSSAKIRMSPSCTSKNGNAAGTSTCTVEFAELPKGWALPTKTLEGVGGVNSCGAGYKTFTQKTLKPNTAQSQCA